MARVDVANVSKRFGPVVALDDVTFSFADGRFFALLGPSGSGKTTLLRMIAGFEEADAGNVSIAGEPVDDVPVEKRDIGMVFQNYALFPNMNVHANVAFGLDVRGIGGPEIKRRVGEALELVRLTGYDARRPDQLSGGQRQRVALARAIVTQPRVLLLDEPLSALDRSLRVEMEIELRRIQRDIGITTIFVTHDQEEALTMSDHIGILNEGRLVQHGPPLEVYERPNSVFSARFLGEANLLAGEASPGTISLDAGTTVKATHDTRGRAMCSVRPEKISLYPSGCAPAGRNILSGIVREHIFAGNSLTYRVECGGEIVRVFAQNLTGDVFGEGTMVDLIWEPKDTVVLADV
ncbi:MAG: ABC transporter ATP-binding protein [Rhodospirillales bacterium]